MQLCADLAVQVFNNILGGMISTLNLHSPAISMILRSNKKIMHLATMFPSSEAK